MFTVVFVVLATLLIYVQIPTAVAAVIVNYGSLKLMRRGRTPADIENALTNVPASYQILVESGWPGIPISWFVERLGMKWTLHLLWPVYWPTLLLEPLILNMRIERATRPFTSAPVALIPREVPRGAPGEPGPPHVLQNDPEPELYCSICQGELGAGDEVRAVPAVVCPHLSLPRVHCVLLDMGRPSLLLAHTFCTSMLGTGPNDAHIILEDMVD